MSSGKKGTNLGTFKEEVRQGKRRSYANKGRERRVPLRGNSERGGIC